mmetsp:Transcript_708/g.2558  ORF Transcript_708/g.2558 Transcript_708/m.2558 type:complete len:252 (-) Transcript_708:415-1170(-)
MRVTSEARVIPRVSCCSSSDRRSPSRAFGSYTWTGERLSGPHPAPRPRLRTRTRSSAHSSSVRRRLPTTPQPLRFQSPPSTSKPLLAPRVPRSSSRPSGKAEEAVLTASTAALQRFSDLLATARAASALAGSPFQAALSVFHEAACSSEGSERLAAARDAPVPTEEEEEEDEESGGVPSAAAAAAASRWRFFFAMKALYSPDCFHAEPSSLLSSSAASDEASRGSSAPFRTRACSSVASSTSFTAAEAIPG